MRIFTLLFIILLTIGQTQAQKGNLRGVVSESDKQALPGASVTLENTQFVGVTNMLGEFNISSIEPGKYTLKVSYIGFKPYSSEVEIKSGSTTTLNIALEAGLELSEVVINERLVGEAKAMNNQKNSISITNMISYEQLERFPDSNIGDALKRLSGINVQYDQGEARFGNIRGTSPELNSITVNGERIPSAEAEIRVVQLDLVPSDMIQAVEFNKALTPDMDADAIGGSVNLVTKSAPYKQEISGKLGTGWNFVSEKLTYKGQLTYGNRFFNDKLGVIVSASIYDNQLGSDNMEATWNYSDENDKDGSAYPEEFEVRQYYIERLRQSYSASFDFKFNENHSLYFNSILNHRNDWENRYRLTYTDIEEDAGVWTTEVRRQLKFGVKDNNYARLEDQRMYNFNFGGDHYFGKAKLDWSVAYSVASEERPNERYLRVKAEGVPISLNLADKEQPVITFTENAVDYENFTNAYEFDELTEQYQWTEEVDQNAKMNFELPLMDGDYANILKLGVRYRGKSKMRDNWLKEYEPVDEDGFTDLALANTYDATKDNFMAGDYRIGTFVKPEISDKINLYDEAQFEESDYVLEEEAGDFEASENIMAGYLMLTQNFGSRLKAMVGVRMEQTMLEYQGRIYDVPSADEEDAGAEPTITNSEKVNDDYINVLPALHLKYVLTEKSNLRFAYTNTLARPNYYDLVPYQQIDRDDEAISFGNPELVPTKSMNLDLMYENFFSSVGVLSGGVFYKSLTDVIAWEYQSDYVFNGVTYKDYRKPMNIADASLLGFEAGFARRMDFLPGFLKNISFYGNYTFVQSELKNIEFEGREDEKLPLAGSPKHSYNVSLAYDTKRMDVRVSFNHTSAFLNVNDDGGFGEEKFFDYYYDAVNYLDVNANYKLNKYLELTADVNNLLNQPLRTYAGISERTVQSEYYGIKFNFGLKFKF